MGGDNAPAATVAGAARALQRHGLAALLVGDQALIARELAALGLGAGDFEIVHAPAVVGMDEHPATAVRKKRDSSIMVAAELVKRGTAKALVSMGNSGATMAAAVLVVGRLDGVDRPALGAVIPVKGGKTIILDAGANSECSAENLRQFALMGSVYMQRIYNVERPKVGLLNVGEEPGKGSKLYREAFDVLAGAGFNFVGNAEGIEIFSGKFDVVVCDGFTGNVALKVMEGVGDFAFWVLRSQVKSSPRNLLGALLMRPALSAVRREFDYSETGGAPLLGIDGVVLIGHGRSDAKAVASGLLAARAALHAGLVEQMAAGLARRQT